METTMLLETYLKQLRLPTVLRNYRQVGQDAAQADHSYDRYLLALVEQSEVEGVRGNKPYHASLGYSRVPMFTGFHPSQ